MEQDIQANGNNNQAEENIAESGVNDNNKKIILLVGAIVIILGVVASYFLFFSNKEDENTPVLENEKVEEAEIDKELDSDQDGLPDYIEEVLETDLNNSDTDSDGYSDFEEIKNGYDPVSDKKYTEEEWETVKEEIKNENEKLHESIFITEDEKEIRNIFKSYTKSVTTSDIETFLDTITSKSKAELNNILVSYKYKTKQFENVNYMIVERNEKYAVMTPEFREQEYGDGEKKKMPNIYFEYEKGVWKVDHILVQVDGITREHYDSEEAEEVIATFMYEWRSGKSLVDLTF